MSYRDRNDARRARRLAHKAALISHFNRVIREVYRQVTYLPVPLFSMVRKAAP